MTVWITKYALTKGIIEAEAKKTSYDSVLINIKGLDLKLPTNWFYQGDWHTTKEAAIVKAEEMRQKKIKNLRKQLEKLEEIRFE